MHVAWPKIFFSCSFRKIYDCWFVKFAANIANTWHSWSLIVMYFYSYVWAWHCETYVMYFVVGLKTVDQVRDLVPTFRQRQQFRGLGGELMKQACSFLIEKCSLAVMPFHNHQVIGKLWWELFYLFFYYYAVCFILTFISHALWHTHGTAGHVSHYRTATH